MDALFLGKLKSERFSTDRSECSAKTSLRVEQAFEELVRRVSTGRCISRSDTGFHSWLIIRYLTRLRCGRSRRTPSPHGGQQWMWARKAVAGLGGVAAEHCMFVQSYARHVSSPRELQSERTVQHSSFEPSLFPSTLVSRRVLAVGIDDSWRGREVRRA